MIRRSVNSNMSSLSVPLLQQESPQGSQSSILDDAFPPTVVEKKLKFKCPTWCRPFTRNAKRMNIEDRMNLNWVQKWLKYGRFPWKFIFHALLTAACTAMVFLQTNDQTTYVIGMDATWYQVFFPDDFIYQGDFGDNSYYFYNINDTVESIRYAIQRHEDFPNFSVVPFTITPIGSSVALLTVIALQHNRRSYRDCNKVYDPSVLNLDIEIDTNIQHYRPLNDLTGEPLRNFFHCMQTMTVEFGYTSVHLQYDHPLEYQLNIKLLYDNSIQGGRIALSLSWTKGTLTNLPYVELLQLYKAMLDLAIIFFAVMSQILSWVSIGKSFQLFASARRKLSRRDLFTSVNLSSSSTPISAGSDITWGTLPLRTKLRFFNMWFVVTILGNLSNICAALLDFFITEDSETSPIERLLLGLGTLLAWINLVRYLEFDKKYTVLIAALQRGFPSALRFLLGVLPVFIGFALFGVVYFSETSSRFSSFGVACVTLFGLQNGDDVQGTFRETARNSLVSRIYLGVFIFISIYGVANIFIAIMDESYSMSIRQAENERLKQKEKLAPSRESDLNNDDDLWTAVLGISKSNDTTINPPPSPRAPSPVGNSNDKDDESNNDSNDDGDENERVEKFMAFLDAQQAKFRQEILSSLHTYTKTSKVGNNNNNNNNNNNDQGNNNNSPQSLKNSRKISFDLNQGIGPTTKYSPPTTTTASPSLLRKPAASPPIFNESSDSEDDPTDPITPNLSAPNPSDPSPNSSNNTFYPSDPSNPSNLADSPLFTNSTYDQSLNPPNTDTNLLINVDTDSANSEDDGDSGQ